MKVCSAEGGLAYAVLEGNGRYQDIVLALSKERSW